MMQNGILDFHYREPYSFTSKKDNLTFNIPKMIKYICTDFRNNILIEQKKLTENLQEDISDQLIKDFNLIKDFHLIKQLVADKTSVLNEFFFEIIGTYNLKKHESYVGKDIAACIASFLSFQDINNSNEMAIFNEESSIIGNNEEFNSNMF